MRKIIFQSAISVDGFIEGPRGEMDWLDVRADLADASRFFLQFDTIFYGRKAYERFGIFAEGSRHAEEFCPPFLRAASHMRKYVFSRLKKHVAGNGMVVSDNLEGEVKRIREEEGKNILLCGGADILKTFARLDLVDAYFLTVYPVILRRGKPLFEGKQRPDNLKLMDKHHLKSGTTTLHYLPASRIKHAAS